MRHQSTDTRDTQDTMKPPQRTQQAHESAPGTWADCMLASRCSPGRLCPLCLCVSMRYGDGLGGGTWMASCQSERGRIGQSHLAFPIPPGQYCCSM